MTFNIQYIMYSQLKFKRTKFLNTSNSINLRAYIIFNTLKKSLQGDVVAAIFLVGVKMGLEMWPGKEESEVCKFRGLYILSSHLKHSNIHYLGFDLITQTPNNKLIT